MKTRYVIAIIGALVAVAPPAVAQGYGHSGSATYPTFPGTTYSPRREEERRWQESERERQRMMREREQAQRNYYNTVDPYGTRKRRY